MSDGLGLGTMEPRAVSKQHSASHCLLPLQFHPSLNKMPSLLCEHAQKEPFNSGKILLLSHPYLPPPTTPYSFLEQGPCLAGCPRHVHYVDHRQRVGAWEWEAATRSSRCWQCHAWSPAG